MPKKLTITEIIQRANNIHNNKYDYSKLDITKNLLEFQIIICPIHGEFKQTINEHINNKHGCIKCGFINSIKNKILPISKFIEKANLIHNNKFDYSKIHYNNLHDKIKIICPIHGEFEQLAWNHINPKNSRGCKQCHDEEKLLTKEEFINESNIIHSNKYDYSLIDWKTTKHKIKIICPAHGEFEQLPSNHLYNKYGCDKCRILNSYCNQNDIINKFISIHGNKYNYSNVLYAGRFKKVKIICPIHGEFEQTPNSHLAGNGCRFCHESKGERKIRLWLIKHNIKYEPQKKFDSCIGKRNFKLPFDFYLIDKNILIEYDGKLHFISWSNSKNSVKRFKRIQETDKIKNEWCVKNNIKLIRISYKNFKNIEKILDSLGLQGV